MPFVTLGSFSIMCRHIAFCMLLHFGICTGIGGAIWGGNHSISHGILGAVLSLALFGLCSGGKKSATLIYLLLFSMSFLVILGNGYTLWADLTNTVAQMRGIIKEEPTAGIFTNYIRAYITNCTYEDFRPNTREDENYLIVTNLLGMLPGEKNGCDHGGLLVRRLEGASRQLDHTVYRE